MFDISVLYTFYQDCSITYMLLIGSMDPALRLSELV